MRRSTRVSECYLRRCVATRTDILLCQLPVHLQELDDNVSAVYKLHGKVLVAVDAADARGTVNSRLDFIKNEL